MMLVGHLVPYMNEVVYRPDSVSGKEAITLMLSRGLGSLALINGDGRRAVGLVRRKKLLLHFVRYGCYPDLASEVRESVDELHVDDPVFEAFGKLGESYGLLVRGAGGQLTHIVTNRVLAKFWIAYAEPFHEIEKTEKALRRLISRIDEDTLERISGKRDIERMNPRDYAEVVEHCFDYLQVGQLDIGVLKQELVRFAEFRNQVMHFRLHRGHEDGGNAVRTSVQNLRAVRELLDSIP